MPTIIGELHGLEHYAWVNSVFMLALTITQPLYGRLADALGRKRVIVAAITMFCVASLLGSTAHSMVQLIIYRGMQGLGAGGIMPVVLTILGDIFTLEERAKIQGLFSSIWGTAALAGPALGAWLVNTLGWRSIFFVNLPLGTLGLIVLMWKYHDREKPHSTDLDLTGATALAIGCASLLALVSRIGPGGWSWWIATLLVILTLMPIGFYIRHAHRSEHPILPIDFIASRVIGPSIIGAAIFGAGFLSLDTYVPLYVQGGRGGGATAAAGVVTPVMLTWALSGVFAAPLVVRWGFRRTALLGTTLIVVGFVGLIICAVTSAPQTLLTAVLSITGLGFGPASMSYLLAAQDAVTWQQRGSVTSAVGFFRTIGGAVGIGILGAVFNLLMRREYATLERLGIKPAQLLDPKSQTSVAPELLNHARNSIATSLIWVFAIMACVAVAGIVVTLRMPSRKSEHDVRASESLEARAG
jgi:MFS family permease